MTHLGEKTYTKTKEKFHLGLIWNGETQLHWRNSNSRDIFNCKGEVVHFLNSLGFDRIRFKEYENEEEFKEVISTVNVFQNDRLEKKSSIKDLSDQLKKVQ